jgi:BlaI family penicillinase repressor
VKKIPRISETEWEIMKVVWARGECLATQILADLEAADPSWHPKTARTLIGRLVKKKALGYRAQGRAYVYKPLVTEAECVAAVSESFLDRVFNGALQPMLAHFVKARKLGRTELAELRGLLDKK